MPVRTRQVGCSCAPDARRDPHLAPSLEGTPPHPVAGRKAPVSDAAAASSQGSRPGQWRGRRADGRGPGRSPASSACRPVPRPPVPPSPRLRRVCFLPVSLTHTLEFTPCSEGRAAHARPVQRGFRGNAHLLWEEGWAQAVSPPARAAGSGAADPRVCCLRLPVPTVRPSVIPLPTCSPIQRFLISIYCHPYYLSFLSSVPPHLICSSI